MTAPAVLDRVRELRRVRAGELVAHPSNWRQHPPAQRAALEHVLQAVGFAGALLAREDGDGRLVLIDGHLRAETTPDLEVPVLVLDVSEQEAELLLATYDPIGALAEANADTLTALMATITARDADVARWLPALVREVIELPEAEATPPPGRTDPDVVPDLPIATPTTVRGDVWVLGGHRLLCDDALEPAAVDRLYTGHAVDAVVTDPPYAIYGSATGVSSEVTDDLIVRPFFEAVLRVCRARLKVFGHAYLCCDWRTWAAIWEAGRHAQMTAQNMIVWDKGSFGLGSNYANNHELVAFYARLPPARTIRGSGPVGKRLVHRANVIHLPRAHGDDRQHTAAKPVALFEELVRNATEAGEVVLDPFVGSGTTIMAAERLGRRCWALELEPRHVDVAVRRWELFTGQTAIRETTPPPRAATKPAKKPAKRRRR